MIIGIGKMGWGQRTQAHGEDTESRGGSGQCSPNRFLMLLLLNGNVFNAPSFLS